MYDTVENAADKLSMKAVYLQLISLLREYELYRTVLLVLSPTGYEIQTLPTSSAAIEAQYQSILMEENNALDVTIMDYQQQAELGILSVRDQAALDEAIKVLEANKKQQEELQKQRQDEYQMKLLEMQQQFDLYVSQAQINPEIIAQQQEEGLSLSAIINRIEANRNTFQTIKRTLETDLYENQSEYESKLNSYIEEGMKAPYSASEMVCGVPTEVARNNRRVMLANEFNSSEGVYYRGIAEALYSEAFGRLSAITNSTLDYIELIDGQIFSFSSSDDEVSTVIEYFTPNNNSWIGSADVTIGNQTIELYFTIPYSGWTGEAVPSQRQDPAGYSAFLDETTAWLEILQNYPSSYYIMFNFEVSASAENSDYEIVFNNYEIRRSDTGETAIKASINQTNTVSYGTHVDILDFTVDSMDLIDSSQYRFVREKGDVSEEKATVSHAVEIAEEDNGPVYASSDEAAATAEASRENVRSLFSMGKYFGAVNASYLMPADKTLGFDWALGASLDFMFALGTDLYMGVNMMMPFGFASTGPVPVVGDSSMALGASVSVMWIHPLLDFLSIAIKADGGALVWGEKPETSFYIGADAGLVLDFDVVGISIYGSASWLSDRLLYGGTVGIMVPFG